MVLQDLGQLEEARDLLREALASDEKSFSPAIPRSPRGSGIWRLVLQDLGQMEEARDLLRHALAWLRSRLNPAIPSSSISESNWRWC